MSRVAFLGFILMVFLICVGTVSADDNLVVNGGFEQPITRNLLTFDTIYGSSLTGWTITPASSISDGSIDLIHGYWQPHSGVQSIDLAGYQSSMISQTLQTNDKDGSYTITFWMAGNAYTGKECSQVPKQLAVYWNGEKLSKTYSFDVSGKSTENMGWEQVTISGLKATTSTTVIAFENVGSDDACGVALDDISVVDPPVTPTPEFPTTTLPVAMMIGFLGMILYIRKMNGN